MEVLLCYGEQCVRVVALVDSGADMSLIEVGRALDLGLDPADADHSQAVGAGGAAIECLSWPGLELQFEQDRFPFEGRFVDFAAEGAALNLLGRRDFFQRYIVQFWDAADLFGIDLSPDFPRTSQPLG